MRKGEKVSFIMDALVDLYPSPAIPLDHYSPYTLLVAVLLSAQTTDKKVNEVTPTLFRLADTPFAMIKQSIEDIKSCIKEIGLSNTKARHIYQLSHILVSQYQGAVPETFEALETLPGVGHKTASVVMSQAFGVPAFPVDTHIHRLMWRWGLSKGAHVEQTEKDAKRLFPRDRWNILHLQIIYYAREYSPSRNMTLEKDFITRTIGRADVIKNTALKL